MQCVLSGPATQHGNIKCVKYLKYTVMYLDVPLTSLQAHVGKQSVHLYVKRKASLPSATHIHFFSYLHTYFYHTTYVSNAMQITKPRLTLPA